ncbi:hypothetical protein AAHA92_34006 [Salvia divinorum]|uniref:Uncharacterized protein n=1 Tax=Salvia divinorum TaxID=28513 RepID=A0ABD1FHH7_SALDI
MEEPPKKVPISLLSSKEESSDSEWDEELTPEVVEDSYEGNSDEDDKGVGSNKRRKIVCPAKTNPLDDDKDVGSSQRKREKIVCPANPDDYPQLASFLRQNHMEEELQQNWTVIGNENASKLQQQWIQIMDKQMDVAAVKLDLIQDIFDIISPQHNLFLPDYH